MGKWKRARLILVIWAVLVLCLAVLAVVARHRRQDWIAREAVAALTADAESGTVEGSDYLYGFGWQGPMVDLIERGRHYPAMERVMLLLEARRVHDWVYLYPRYRNADLRAGLIRHCLEHFPDDPLVHWAAGRLKLVAGEYVEASFHFVNAESTGFDPRASGIPAEDFKARCLLALDLSFLSGHGVGFYSGAEIALEQDYGSDPKNDDLALAYFDYLCRWGKYDQVISGINERSRRYSTQPSPELRRVLLRAYLWSGDIEKYIELAGEKQQGQQSATGSFASPMLTLLEGDISSAWSLAESIYVEEEWWNEWLHCWEYFRLLADAFVATGDEAYLAELDWWRDATFEGKQQLQDVDNPTWMNQFQALDSAGQLISIAGQKARAHALRGEWDAAADALAEVDPDSVYRKDISYESVSALVAITRGESLEERSLADLASTGAVLDVMLSPQLASAAEVGGMTLDEAREQLLAAARPEHSNYHWHEDQVLDW